MSICCSLHFKGNKAVKDNTSCEIPGNKVKPSSGYSMMNESSISITTHTVFINLEGNLSILYPSINNLCFWCCQKEKKNLCFCLCFDSETSPDNPPSGAPAARSNMVTPQLLLPSPGSFAPIETGHSWGHGHRRNHPLLIIQTQDNSGNGEWKLETGHSWEQGVIPSPEMDRSTGARRASSRRSHLVGGISIWWPLTCRICICIGPASSLPAPDDEWRTTELVTDLTRWNRYDDGFSCPLYRFFPSSSTVLCSQLANLLL
jgi:hypothetical protein